MDNIILDTDTYNECDDQFALAYLLKNQDKFNIEAITVAPYSHSDRKETIEETTEKSYNEILKICNWLNFETKNKVFKGSLDYICKLYNVKAEFYTRTSTVEWLGEGMDNIFIILGIRFISSLFVMSIAYICGSIFYRLKMKYNILVFILIPGILFGVVFNILFSNRYIGDKLGTIMWSITCFVEKPIITIILEILLTGLFIIIGNKFLKNAPIAEYAHDLI